MQFANFGIQSSNTYLAAQDESRLSGLVANSIWVALAGGIGFSILAICLIYFYKSPHTIAFTNLLFILILAPTNLFFLFGGNLLVAINKIKTYNFMQLSSNIILICSIVIAALFYPKVKGFLSASIIGWSITAIILYIIFVQQIRINLKFDTKIFSLGFHYALKAYLTTLLGYLVLKSNIYILQAYCGNQSVGYFSIASQINDVMAIGPATIALLLFPQLVKNFTTRRQETIKNMLFMTIIMLLACIFAAIVVKPFILIVYGKAYYNSISVLFWMLPGIFFMGITNITTQYLAAIGFPKVTIYVWGITFIVVILTSLCLIPKYAENGAAMALSIGYFLLFCMMLYVFKLYKHKG